MKKVFVFMMAAAVLAAAGCSKKEAAAGGAAAAKPVTLTVFWFNDGNESDVFLATMQDYLAEHPNVKLDMQIVAYSEFDQKLKLMISGGNAPDIARLSSGSLVLFAEQCLPLESYIPELASIKSNFMPSMLEFTYNKKGEMIAFPTEATANGMLVNKTAFKNAGIDVDELSKTWTWDQWQEAARKVIDANSAMKYGLAVDFTLHRFATLMYQYGGRILNDTQTGMGFSNAGTIRTVKFFKDITDKGLVTPSVWMGSENPAELFQSGLVACHIGGSWNINTYNKNIKDFEWGAVHNPVGTVRSSVPGGKFIGSFKDAPNKKEAVEFIKAFSDARHLASYCKGTFNMSSRTDTNIDYPSNSADFAVFAEDLATTPAYTAAEWKNPAVMSVQPYAREQIVEVLQNHETAEEAAAAIDKEGAKYFK